MFMFSLWKTRRQLVIAVSFLVLVAIGSVCWETYRHFFQEKSWFSLQSAVTLEPVLKDDLGVDVKSDFLLKSEEPLDSEALAAHLSVEPQAEFRVSRQDAKSANIHFLDPLKEDSVYVFRLSDTAAGNGDVAEKSGPGSFSWAFQTKNPFRVISTLPRDEATGVPVNSGIEIAFSSEGTGFEDIKDFFEILPKTSGHFETHKKTQVFVPDKLDAGKVYTVKVKKGYGTKGSKDVLSEDKVFRFETQPAEKSEAGRSGFVRDMYEVSSAEKPALDIYASSSVSRSQAQVRVYRLEREDDFIRTLQERDTVPSWAWYSRGRYRLDTSRLTQVADFSSPIERYEWSGYFVFPDTLPKGYYIVEAAIGKSDEVSQTWLQVSDLAVFVSTSDTQTLLWAHDTVTKDPVSEASMEIIGGGAFSGVSGNDGILKAETPQELARESAKMRYMRVSAPHDRKLIIPLMRSSSGYLDYASDADGYWSYLYLDRDTYKPSDEVSFWGLERRRDESPRKQTLKVVVTRDEAAVLEKDIETNDDGTFIGAIPLKGWDTGWYSIAVRTGEGEVVATKHFSVDTYVKPAYRISLETDKKAVFAGEAVTVSGEAAFFEGSPLPGMQLKYQGIGEGEVVTDQNGRFRLSVDTGDSDISYGTDTAAIQYRSISVMPKTAEEGEITGEASIFVAPAKIGIDMKESRSESDRARVKASVFDIDLKRMNQGGDESDYRGAPVGDQAVDVIVSEFWWEKTEVGRRYDFVNKETVKKYRYQQRQREIKKDSVRSDKDGAVLYDFPADPEKFYGVTLSSKDNGGREVRRTTFVYGQFSSSRNGNYWLSDSEKVERDGVYGVGDEVRLVFQKDDQSLPEDSKRSYLFYKSQRGIREYSVQGSPRYTFGFSEKDVPNVVVNAVYFNGRTYVTSQAYQADFRNKDRAMDIQTRLDKDSYRPRDTVTLDVKTRDLSGRPVSAAVNVSAVDEAFFALAPQSVDTLDELYRNVGSGVLASYASHQYPTDKDLAESGGCFLGDTPILMADRTLVPIRDVRPGDRVLTRKSALSEEMVEANVSRTFHHVVGSYILVNNRLKVTPEHNLYVNGRWMMAEEIRIGDFLLDESGQWQEVVTLEGRAGSFDVYNLEIETYHTFFAGGVYVHNSKGREVFMDSAFFGAVRTDKDGNGKVSFSLPDNLTSWRLTYQGISDSLLAGSGSVNAQVKLPFFVDAVMSDEYLVEDRPVMLLRAFGDSLVSGQAVTFTVTAPSLGVQDGTVLTGKAFSAVPFSVPELKEGEHLVTIKARAGNMEDSVTRRIRVVQSRIRSYERNFSTLRPGMELRGGDTGLTQVVISDEGRARFYGDLLGLAGGFGDRLDQRMARSEAQRLLAEVFHEPGDFSDVTDTKVYQTTTGGASLLPYSDDDLELSAQVAAVGGGQLGADGLERYFMSVVNDVREGRDREAVALYGLAALRKPVLTRVNRLLEYQDLAVEEQLYLGLALAEFGDKERAKSVLTAVMDRYGKVGQGFAVIRSGDSETDNLKLTALAADLAGLTGESHGDALYGYLSDNSAKDIDTVLQRMIYIRSALKRLPDQKVSFTYVVDGKGETKTLEHGGVLKLALSAEQLKTVRFENVQGNVGVTTAFEHPLDQEAMRQHSGMSVERSYGVSGKTVQDFDQSDLVKVTLRFAIPESAPDGCYQLSDYLPSGLKVVTGFRPEYAGTDSDDVWYPYDVDGQRVSFCVDKKMKKPISYYARVSSPGEYRSEKPVLQSMQDVSDISLGNEQRIRIR